MNYIIGSILIAGVLISEHALATEMEEGDPVRNAQRMKDCVARHIARNDGSSKRQIKRACVKEIEEGTFEDKNISLDGMIKTH